MSTPLVVKNRAPVTGVIDAVADTVVLETEEAGLVTAVVDSVSSASGITLEFEGQFSDSGPWVRLVHRATDSNSFMTNLQTATAAVSTLPTVGWAIATMGSKRVRARCTALVGGSLVLRLTPSHRVF